MKTLKKGDMAELIGQFVDVVQDFLESKQAETIIEGNDYDSLASKFKEILYNWDLAEEVEECTQEEREELEEWNTPTD